MRSWRKTFVGIFIALVVLAAPLAATPPRDASGLIQITGQVIDSTRQAGPNTIITGRTMFTLSGDLSGEAVYAFRQVNHQDGSLNSQGVVTCECEVDGKVGTLIIGVSGTGEVGPPVTFSGRSTILAADGGLEGLHGVFTFDQVGFTATYEGRIHFEN
jgi:hypothetical protein